MSNCRLYPYSDKDNIPSTTSLINSKEKSKCLELVEVVNNSQQSSVKISRSPVLGMYYAVVDDLFISGF